MLGQIFKAIAAVFIFIILVIVFAVSTITLGTITAVGLIILGVGLFMLVAHKGPVKIGAIMALTGFIIFLIGYLGLL